MLDFFLIFSKGGLLLWCFRGAGINPDEFNKFKNTVNTFIKTVLLQEMTSKSLTYESGSMALKYKLDNEFDLVFVAAYQKMLPLLYLDKLLDEIQLRFRDKYNNQLKDKNYFCSYNFTSEFDRTLTMVESSSKKAETQRKSEMRTFEDSAKSKKTIGSMIENNNKENNAAKKAGQTGKDTSKPLIESNQSSDELDEETRIANLNALKAKMAGGPGKKASKVKSPKPEKQGGKKKTNWDPFMFGGSGATGAEAKSLERGPKHEEGQRTDEDLQLSQFADSALVGKSAQIGDIEEDSSEDEEVIEENARKSGGGGIWGSLSTLVGQKNLSSTDLAPVISKMQDHLISKNVAADVALKLCQSVAYNLEGKVLGTFSSIHRTVKGALVESLMKLLTPKRRLDVIRDVMEAKRQKRPYVMTFCGVNGVGKSTNLAKICFWLVENKCRVLIAACDTFRAGAVEQLRTHTRRLNALHPAPETRGGKPYVELYEKGYGKDAAGIALEAINYARHNDIDVVLVDTAGRMQDNEPLMRSLAKLISINAPDLVLFVGEALVGNEAVDQLVKFNAALADHSQQNNPHLIDGIVLTKFDTIDDKVGSAISMTYITGQPIVFVGTGQTYTDLKSLNAKAVVNALMK